MEFGHIYDDLEKVDFSLPGDSAITDRTLVNFKGKGELQIHIGGTKWSNPEWKGRIYPVTTSASEFAREYSRQFNTIEFNATFYTLNDYKWVSNMVQKIDTNLDFKFCPKVPQMISHMRRLRNSEAMTDQFWSSLKGFGNHLGPAFLQLGDNFTYKSFQDLKAYVQYVPKTYPLHIEVRHKDWFAVPEYRSELFNLLYELELGTVITDASGRRDCAHMELTIPSAFIRFVGNNLHKTDYKRLDEWVERIDQWKEKGLQSLWFFIHQHDERFTPDTADYFIKQLNNVLGTNVKPPTMTNGLFD